MTDQQVIELIESEFKERTLGVTDQYLEIHSPIYIGNHLKVDRIDRDGDDDIIIAYLPVLDGKFYFVVYIVLGLFLNNKYKVVCPQNQM